MKLLTHSQPTFEVSSNNWISGIYSHSRHGKNHKYVSLLSLRSLKGQRAQLLLPKSSSRLDLSWSPWLHPLCQAAAVQLGTHPLPWISSHLHRGHSWDTCKTSAQPEVSTAASWSAPGTAACSCPSSSSCLGVHAIWSLSGFPEPPPLDKPLLCRH